MIDPTFANSIYAVRPELLLASGICVIIMADMLLPLADSRRVCGVLAAITCFTAFAALLFAPEFQVQPFAGTLLRDRLGSILSAIFFAGTFVAVVAAMQAGETRGFRQGEFFSLLLGGALSASILASANNLVVFVVAFETLSLCSYVLAGFFKHNRRSAEASLKYMLYGSVASGVMLFGFTYIYGLTGTLQIDEAFSQLAGIGAAGGERLTILLALLFVLAGIGFKMALVPFQFWCPDVYEGSPTAVTAFLSVVSKAAGFSALIRLAAPVIRSSDLAVFFASSSPGAVQLLFGIMAAITMTFGNLAAIKQENVKRLLAYSSIAHAGYLLMAFAVFTPEAVEAMLIYLLVYFFMNFTAFFIVILFERELGSVELERFKGAAYHAPFLFALLFIALVALTGLPPTAGFVGKFMLFKVVVGAGINAMPGSEITAAAVFYFALALLGVLNSLVSLYYYMKLARVMVFERSDGEQEIRTSALDNVFALALTTPLLLLLYFTPLVDLVHDVLSIDSPIFLALLK